MLVIFQFNNRGINKEFMGKAMEETVAGTTAFKSKLTFQIQHEVFRYIQIKYLYQSFLGGKQHWKASNIIIIIRL